MATKAKQPTDNKLKVTEFTYSEFIDFTQNAKAVSGSDGLREDSHKGSAGFTGTDNFADALYLAKNGWEAGIKELELEKDLIIAGSFEMHNAIAGACVNVGEYLAGSPECMIQFVEYVERDKPELTVYVMLSYSAFISQKEAQEYAKKVLALTTELNQKYSVKLVGVFAAIQSGGVKSIELITIKDFYQEFVLNNLAFAFHPSFFRRLWFRFIETKPYRSSGYGSTMGAGELKDFLLKNKNNSDKCLYFPALQHSRLNWEINDAWEF